MWESASEITQNEENSEELQDLRDMRKGTHQQRTIRSSNPRGSIPRKKYFYLEKGIQSAECYLGVR